jgi:hypothetical protein
VRANRAFRSGRAEVLNREISTQVGQVVSGRLVKPVGREARIVASIQNKSRIVPDALFDNWCANMPSAARDTGGGDETDQTHIAEPSRAQVGGGMRIARHAAKLLREILRLPMCA